MCLIIYKAPGATLPPESQLYKAARINDDGAGLLDMDTGAVYKSLNSNDIVKRLVHNTGKRAHVAVHFRSRTHGPVDLLNTHPFELPDGGYLMHNGVLSKFGTNTLSDTGDFAAMVSELLHRHGWSALDEGSALRRMIDAVTSGSRILIADPEGQPIFFGSWTDYEGGCKVSNEYSLKEYTTYSTKWGTRSDADTHTRTSRRSYGPHSLGRYNGYEGDEWRTGDEKSLEDWYENAYGETRKVITLDDIPDSERGDVLRTVAESVVRNADVSNLPVPVSEDEIEKFWKTDDPAEGDMFDKAFEEDLNAAMLSEFEFGYKCGYTKALEDQGLPEPDWEDIEIPPAVRAAHTLVNYEA